eukprot:Gb_34959 [translate_table: standard]
MAAYAMNPKWCDNNVTEKRPLSEEHEVTNGLFTVVTKIYGDSEEATLIREQFCFIRGRGEFGNLQSLRHRTKIKDSINWWTINGRQAPELKTLATWLLAQVASSSPCERN